MAVLNFYDKKFDCKINSYEVKPIIFHVAHFTPNLLQILPQGELRLTIYD